MSMKTKEACVEFVNQISENILKPMAKEERNIQEIIKSTNKANREFRKIYEEMSLSHPEVIASVSNIIDEIYGHPADIEETAVEVLAQNLFFQDQLFSMSKDKNITIKSKNIETFKEKVLTNWGWYDDIDETLKTSYKDKARKLLKM